VYVYDTPRAGVNPDWTNVRNDPHTDPQRMAAFTAKYTADQREAIASAVIDRGASAPRVVELAAAGQLTDSNGAALDPFAVPANTVRSEARKAKKRRQGKTVSELAQLPPRDAIEALRRRLINAADAMLAEELKKPAKTRDPERLRQIGRCVREFAAIPGPKETAPKRPGQKTNGEREQGGTGGGLAGGLLAAHRSQTATSGKGRPRQDHATGPEQQDIGAQQTQHEEAEGHEQQEDDGSPGSSARGLDHASLVPAA
jgi:hypothetical protein